ncbi:MAG: polyprenyl synthetase family protein [Alphaproteobacteria bacterium]|nr:polyprenyl synthetase family protein [Alphaproteobacteria bacterium]
MQSTKISESLGRTGALIEAELTALLEGERVAGAPERLIAAMRHAVLGGGKRLRPFLVLESSRLFGIDQDQALPSALAVELIHGYSLIHDDLPAMDNDELRRGRPTVWKEFDEWTAILAGDGLQALAFEVVVASSSAGKFDEAKKTNASSEIILRLAEASGVRGMVGGQAFDLDAEKRLRHLPSDAGHIRRLQAMKTGALIRFSCEAGAILAGAAACEREALRCYGAKLGLAFQIADDLLDVEGDATVVGKAVAKDAAAGKATLVSLVGVEAARRELDRAVAEAKDALRAFAGRSQMLELAADFVSERDR